MVGRKPDGLQVLKGVRPGGGRKKHLHALTPLLQAPEHLDAEAKNIFNTVRENAPAGMLAEVDRFLVEIFADHVCLHRRCVREVDKLTVGGKSSPRANPLLAASASQAKILLSLAESLGLTAAARQRLKLPEVVSDAWADVSVG